MPCSKVLCTLEAIRSSVNETFGTKTADELLAAGHNVILCHLSSARINHWVSKPSGLFRERERQSEVGRVVYKETSSLRLDLLRRNEETDKETERKG